MQQQTAVQAAQDGEWQNDAVIGKRLGNWWFDMELDRGGKVDWMEIANSELKWRGVDMRVIDVREAADSDDLDWLVKE